MIWIKLRDKLPLNNDTPVRYAYLRHDGTIVDYDLATSGWALNQFAALYALEPATILQSETVWQYADATTSH